jgi:hypothetical protein
MKKIDLVKKSFSRGLMDKFNSIINAWNDLQLHGDPHIAVTTTSTGWTLRFDPTGKARDGDDAGTSPTDSGGGGGVGGGAWTPFNVMDSNCNLTTQLFWAYQGNFTVNTVTNDDGSVTTTITFPPTV